MDLMTMCTVVASLRVHPVRSQFFQYESFSLVCEQQGSPAEDWRVKRSTAFHQEEDCPPPPSRGHGPNCSIDDLYFSDSGVYWCESAAGRCSNTINITVTRGSVILEGPVHPVDEGEAVTLRCRTRAPSSNLTYFYKDDLLVGNSTSGNLTIRRVSPSDEGLYKCSVAGLGPSPSSWLAVRGRPETHPSVLPHALLPVVGVCLVLPLLLWLWRRRKGEVKSAVSYTDVSIIPPVNPQRIRGEKPPNDEMDRPCIFYSTLRLDIS
ncbi:low affinity immunoglobulin gamma Fc region receptor II-b-like isoform X2 [Cololabis saira]|uniref:low affinity immunoglobulin gamma Fc region receptor II-b-like isoform X2 n=1 Tax=Cololabis saira TaxID=129043 RepID=UPI002AD32902|nr:low affinity immunoglobulin gamma Fc region receptor II-b-like isoform X2 [Cololabis saira]